MGILCDAYERRFRYLRLSITDVCNFRCTYCLPNGYQKPSHPSLPLSIEEIKNLISAFSDLGVIKVRLTGGEPLVRPDVLRIIEGIRMNPKILKLGLSTNAYRLNLIAKDLKQAGVTALNVSLDSLDPQRFKEITGKDLCSRVLDGIEKAISLDFDHVKINVVLLKGMTEYDLKKWREWVRDKPVTVRFIELMRTGDNTDFFEKRHLSAGQLQFDLLTSGWKALEKQSDSGPATEYFHPDSQGKIGIIAPYSKDFCQSCNRIRVTSRGKLRLCLFGEQDYSIRHLLQSDRQREVLVQEISQKLLIKPVSHFLKEGRYGNNYSLSTIGG